MTKEKRINIPVTEKEKAKIIKDGLRHGYGSVSEYIRDKMLDNLKK